MFQSHELSVNTPGKEIILADAQSRFRISKIKETFDPEVKIDLVKFSNKHLIEIINESDVYRIYSRNYPNQYYHKLENEHESLFHSKSHINLLK